MANRFFAFGCSFTKHTWPTWAHCSAELHRRMGVVDHTYNFGIGGASNKLIAHTVMLANSVHNIDSEDIVYVQWTTHDRWDMYAAYPHNGINGHEGWHPQGSIFHSDLNPSTIEQVYTPQGFHAETLLYKRLIREIIPHAVFCAWSNPHELTVINTHADPFEWNNTPKTDPKPNWGIELLQEYYQRTVDTDNSDQHCVGDGFLHSARSHSHRPFLLTDTLIDPHPHPQAHFEYAVDMYSRHLSGASAGAFKQVVNSVGDDVIKYTNQLNKQHTDAYTRVHEAFGEEPILFVMPIDTQFVEERDTTRAHREWTTNPVHTSRMYAHIDSANEHTDLNYEMVWDNTVNDRGMHRNTYGDLWYAPTDSVQDILQCENLFGVSYDQLHDEVYAEWCDALYSAQRD